jgi:hypothetical protein
MEDDDLLLEDDDLLIVTDEEIIYVGLTLVNYTEHMLERVGFETNEARFQQLYGSSGVTCAQLWEALQVTATAEARVQEKTQKFYKQQKK